MTPIKIYNAKVLTEGFRFEETDVVIENGRIIQIGKTDHSGGIDASGKYLVPGLVDIHTHGCGGYDCSSADLEGLHRIAQIQRRNGVTTFLATTMSLPAEQLEETYRTIGSYFEQKDHLKDCANMAGVHMEGPYLSEKRKGAHDSRALRNPNIAEFYRLDALCGGNIRLVTVAPELEGFEAFMEQLKSDCAVSIGHSDCTYRQAMAAIGCGVSHATHLYNAMPPFNHRESGVLGAVYDSDIVAELICDGIHIAPEVVRMTFKLLGERVVMISDSMEAAGLEDGKYTLGGQAVTVVNKKATLADGTIAGAACTLMDDVQRCIGFGIAPEIVLKAASYLPAKVIGMEQEIGSIAVGKKADLLLLNSDWSLDRVI